MKTNITIYITILFTSEAREEFSSAIIMEDDERLKNCSTRLLIKLTVTITTICEKKPKLLYRFYLKINQFKDKKCKMAKYYLETLWFGCEIIRETAINKTKKMYNTSRRMNNELFLVMNVRSNTKILCVNIKFVVCVISIRW